MALKVRWVDYIAGMYGTVTEDMYVRRIPGNREWGLLCRRPKYNKKDKTQMAQRETVKNFKALQEIASREYKENRAEWEKRWKAALREEQRHPHSIGQDGRERVPTILWQYVKKCVAKGAQ